MILVCGGLADRVTELVCARLDACGYPYRLLDLGAYPSGFQVNWHWQEDHVSGYIIGPGWRLDLAELSAVYVRFIGDDGRIPLPGIEEASMNMMYSEYDAGLMALLECLPCAVVNRIGAGMSNNSKPYQALLIRQFGLQIPPTLVTNDPAEAQRFYDEYHGDVIYKSTSGTRSIVRRLEPAQRSRFSLLRNGPAQFQLLIRGDDVRVHTIADRVFAVKIQSEAVDYRYASLEGGRVEMKPVVLPPEVETSCLQLAQHLGLLFSGIDLKVTPDGDYYCLEINPSPGFFYYERYTGQPISTALANLLHRGLPGPPSHEAMTSLT